MVTYITIHTIYLQHDSSSTLSAYSNEELILNLCLNLLVDYFLCNFWEGNKGMQWVRYKLAISTSTITFIVCNNTFLSVLSAKHCCLDVILLHLLIIYPFQRQQNPLNPLWTQCSRCVHRSADYRGTIISCNLQAAFLLIMYRELLPFFALFSCKTTFWWVGLQPVLVHGIFLTKGRIWHFMELQSDHSSSLLRSLQNSSPVLHLIDC